MNELLPIQHQNASEITMSSREIAALCEKRHDNVVADIRKMLEELHLNAPDFSGTYKTAQGNEYECFFLPKRETFILVSGYRIEWRAKIIDRWQELETAAKPTALLPDFTNPAAAARAWAEQFEQNQTLQLENQKQSVQIESMTSYFRNGISPFEFVKGLNGVNSLKIGEFLVAKNWLYLDGNRKRVKAYARDRYLTEETTEITQHGKDPFVAYKPVLLKKGAAKLYEWYTQTRLPMKTHWNGELTQDKAVGL